MMGRYGVFSRMIDRPVRKLALVFLTGDVLRTLRLALD